MKSNKAYPVIEIDREALEWAGFEEEKVSDSDMRRLAREMAKEYGQFLFLHHDIARNAAALGFPKDGNTLAYEEDQRLLLNAHLDEIATKKAFIYSIWFLSGVPIAFKSVTRHGNLVSEIDWKTKEVSHEWE